MYSLFRLCVFVTSFEKTFLSSWVRIFASSPCPWGHEADLILSSLSSLGLRAVALSLKVFAGLTHPVFSSALQKLQDMDERRATRLGAGYGLLAEAELQVVPIIGKCLEGMKVAAESVDAKNVGAQREPRGMSCGLTEVGLPRVS